MQSLCGDAVWVVPHEHVGEVGSIVDALLRLLAVAVALEGLHHGLEAGLVEVGEGEPVPCVESDLVRGGGQERVGHVLHHVTCWVLETKVMCLCPGWLCCLPGNTVNVSATGGT